MINGLSPADHVMKKSLLIIFFLSCFCRSYAGGTEILPTHRTVLKNGLTVLATPMPESPMVSVYGLVKTGSASEGEYLGAGLSHFMEHMLFKGTERRGVGDIASEIQSLGGTINAGTHFDYTIYTLTVPAAHFQQAADILSDMLMHPAFDPQEIEKEREVVFNEIRMYHDQPDRYLTKIMFQTVYRAHPYRIPIIGFEELLRPLARDDFLSYYKRHYAPNNMVVAVAGGVSSDEAVNVIEKFFGDYPPGSFTLRAVPSEPRQITERVVEEYYPTDLIRVSAAYAGVDILNPDMAALDALAMILGQGRGSRLYVSLVDDLKIAHAVSASNFTPKDQGVFEIRVSSDQDQVPAILEEIDRQVDLIARKGVSKQELEKAVNNTLKSLLMEFQTSSDTAYRTALDEAVTGAHDFTSWYMEQVKKLTSDDLQRAARMYLIHQRRSVGVLKPERLKADAGVSSEDREALPIQRVVLENGLTVVMQEDPSLPMVWMNLVFQAGLYEEPADLNGLSQLTASLWAKGSRRYSYDQIAEVTEQNGISFSGFSGQNSFGLKINALRKDIELSMALLSDAVLHPLFSEPAAADEQARQQAEILRRNDDIRHIGATALRGMLFSDHPLGRTQLGTMESVGRIARRDIADFQRRYAVPSNAVMSVSGDFRAEEMMAHIKRHFGSWHGGPVTLCELTPEPVFAPNEQTLYADKKQAAVFFGVQAPSFYHEDRYALEVLGALLGSPFNGRMFAVMREKEGLAYSLGGGYAPARTAGEIVFQVLTSAEKAERVKEIFQNILLDLQQEGVSDSELSDIKVYLIGSADRAWERRDYRSFRTALDELYGLGYLDHAQYADRIQAVTARQVQELAQTYFQPDRMAVVTVLPSAEIKETSAAGGSSGL